MGCEVRGSRGVDRRFRVQGLRLGICDVGFGVWGLSSWVLGVGFWGLGFRFRVWGLGYGIRVSGCGV